MTFPTIVRQEDPPRTHFAANLTICLLARSPTATSAWTLNCCWRRTRKHCFPENRGHKQQNTTFTLRTENKQTSGFCGAPIHQTSKKTPDLQKNQTGGGSFSLHPLLGCFRIWKFIDPGRNCLCYNCSETRRQEQYKAKVKINPIKTAETLNMKHTTLCTQILGLKYYR